MALAPTALHVLVTAAGTAAELFELLRLSGCLTARGRANRSTVVAVMTRARDAFQPPYSVGTEPPDERHGCPAPWDSIEEALSRASYLRIAGWPDAERRISNADVEKRVQRIIEDAGVTRRTGAAESTPWLAEAAERIRQQRREAATPGPIRCPECRKHLPDQAQFCVWCGADLPFLCSCRS